MIDKHPLCPTAASISAALDGLADRLAKLGCTVLRTTPNMPDLARTTRNYVELLAAFFSAELSPDERLRVEAAAQALSPDDLSIPAARLRGLTMSHPAWRWLLHRSPAMLPIPGTSSIAHFEENLGAASIRLTAEELRTLAGC